jgi:hypothetical protein
MAPTITTPATKLFGIKHPILLAGSESVSPDFASLLPQITHYFFCSK